MTIMKCDRCPKAPQQKVEWSHWRKLHRESDILLRLGSPKSSFWARSGEQRVYSKGNSWREWGSTTEEEDANKGYITKHLPLRGDWSSKPLENSGKQCNSHSSVIPFEGEDSWGINTPLLLVIGWLTLNSSGFPACLALKRPSSFEESSPATRCRYWMLDTS